MSDNPVLEVLRAIRGDLAEMKADISEIKERLCNLELQYSSLSRRVDHVGGDVERIKIRLDLHDAPVAC